MEYFQPIHRENKEVQEVFEKQPEWRLDLKERRASIIGWKTKREGKKPRGGWSRERQRHLPQGSFILTLGILSLVFSKRLASLKSRKYYQWAIQIFKTHTHNISVTIDFSLRLVGLVLNLTQISRQFWISVKKITFIYYRTFKSV